MDNHRGSHCALLLRLFCIEILHNTVRCRPRACTFIRRYGLIQPFLSTFVDHTTPLFYSGSRDTGLFPLDIYFSWTSPSADGLMRDAILTSAGWLYNHAIELGQNISGGCATSDMS